MFLGSLIPLSDFSLLLHIPELAEHYELHVAEADQNGVEFSFWDFLEIHFFDPDGHQHEGGDQHENCPFHLLHASSSFVLSTIDFAFSAIAIPSMSGNLSYNNAFYLKGYVSVETQPPSLI